MWRCKRSETETGASIAMLTYSCCNYASLLAPHFRGFIFHVPSKNYKCWNKNNFLRLKNFSRSSCSIWEDKEDELVTNEAYGWLEMILVHWLLTGAVARLHNSIVLEELSIKIPSESFDGPSHSSRVRASIIGTFRARHENLIVRRTFAAHSKFMHGLGPLPSYLVQIWLSISSIERPTLIRMWSVARPVSLPPAVSVAANKECSHSRIEGNKKLN